ncbi:hypothetical protein DVH05_028065 [Phytophthora capsici]|nr:hypothetical protein DVH05_028065 [Phytophthora capsici]
MTNLDSTGMKLANVWWLKMITAYSCMVGMAGVALTMPYSRELGSFSIQQKLHDKVKVLAVSLRLLQGDRQLCLGDLCEQKGAFLQSYASAIGFGDVGAADFIGDRGRIQDLEVLV